MEDMQEVLKIWANSIIDECEITFHTIEQNNLKNVDGINDLYNTISKVSIDRVKNQIK